MSAAPASLLAPSCTPFEGNSDFYGQGIRIGVYLQWLSAWLSVLLQPDTAQSILEVNSVFIFAIVIATISAFNSDGIQPIEIYIMLQFCFGFFLTTISIFGLRPQLLRSRSAEQLFRGLEGLPRAIKESAILIGGVPSLREMFRGHPDDSPSQLMLRWIGNYINILSDINAMHIQIDLADFRFIKMQSLAWSGVLWRSGIAGVLAGFNLAFWFGQNPGSATPGACVPVPLVFMFSKLPIQGRLLTLFRVGAIIVAVIVFFPAICLVILSCRLVIYLIMCILRDTFWRTQRPGLRERTQASFDRINRVLGHHLAGFHLLARHQAVFQGTAALSWMFSPFRSWRDFVQFFLSSDVENIQVTDILKLCASFAGSEIKITEDVSVNRRLTATNDDPSSKYKWASRCWNVLTLCIIAWFICSIEWTIRWNEIQGVDTIQSTGQLIPFVIGITSSGAALQTLVVAAIKKSYPDWADMDLEVKLASDGRTEFQIRKKESDAVDAQLEQQDAHVAHDPAQTGPP